MRSTGKIDPSVRQRRIVILSSCPEPWGGSEELWFQAACELRDRGHRVDVLKTLVDPAHPRVQELIRRGCSVRDLRRALDGSAWAGVAGLIPLRITQRIDALVVTLALRGARRPDAAIVSQGINFDGAYLAALCRREQLPHILVSQKASELYWPVDGVRDQARQAHEGAVASVFVSEHNRELTEHQLGVALPHATILPNPLLAGVGGPLPWPADSARTRLACVGRLYASEKGQDVLLKALAHDRWRARPVEVGFYGRGSNREGLQDLAHLLGLDNVSFPGHHTADIEDLWRTHHALVLTSRAEGSPLTVQEAMACGRVPIVTAVGGIPELVQDEVTGFIAEAPTVAAVDETLERAWSRRKEWPAIGARAAARIAETTDGEPGARLAQMALGAADGRTGVRAVS